MRSFPSLTQPINIVLNSLPIAISVMVFSNLAMMKLTNKLENIFLFGSNQLSTLPEEILNTLNQFSINLNTEENINQSILQACSIHSFKKKLAWSFESTSPIPLANTIKEKQNHIPLPKNIQTLLKNLFLEEEEDIIDEFVRLFNYKKWKFPLPLYPDLLNFGIKKQELAQSINNILGEKGLWLAEKNKRWQYAILAFKNANQKSTLPSAKPSYGVQIEYAKIHIEYNPKAQGAEKWSIELPEELTTQLKICQIKNNIYKDYGSNANNYLIQLIRNVNPIDWIGENTADKIQAYYELLLSCNFQDEHRKKAILLGLQKAATLYQDKELIIAQHIYISQESSLWYEDLSNIIGQEITPLFSNEEREMIAAYYIDNILNFKKDFPDNHPFIVYLTNWTRWTETVTIISVTKLARLYRKVSHFSYAYLAMIKRAAYSIPYDLHDDIIKIWTQYCEIPKPIQIALDLIQQRKTLSPYYI